MKIKLIYIYSIILTFIAIILAYLMLNLENENDFLNEIIEQNSLAESNEIKFYKDQLNRETAEKYEYILKLENLEKENKQLYEELKKIKNFKNIKKISDIRVNIDSFIPPDKIKIIKIPTTDFKNFYKFDFSFIKDTIGFYYKISGNNSFEIDYSNKDSLIKNYSINLNELRLMLDIISYTRVDNNKIISGAKAKHPGIVVISTTYNIDDNLINAWKYYIENKNKNPILKRFSIGLQSGIGYDYNKQFFPYLGIGINFAIKELW